MPDQVGLVNFFKNNDQKHDETKEILMELKYVFYTVIGMVLIVLFLYFFAKYIKMRNEKKSARQIARNVLNAK